MESWREGGERKLHLEIVEVGYFHDFLLPFKYLLSFETLLRTEAVEMKTIERNHCQRASVPGECSWRCAWAGAAEVSLIV